MLFTMDKQLDRQMMLDPFVYLYFEIGLINVAGSADMLLLKCDLVKQMI